VVSTRHPAVFTLSRIEVDDVVDLAFGDEFATRAAVAALTTARAITLGSLTAAVLASLVTSGVAHADAAKAAKLLRGGQKLEAKDPKAAQAKLQQAHALADRDDLHQLIYGDGGAITSARFQAMCATGQVDPVSLRARVLVPLYGRGALLNLWSHLQPTLKDAEPLPFGLDATLRRLRALAATQRP
jgi:hypothetical protein